MNYSIILKTLSTVMWIMAAAFGASAGVSAFFAENPLEANAMPAWICAVAMSAMAAFALYIPSRKAPERLFRKEAMCIIGLAWILASIAGAAPYLMILHCPVSAAFFESTSGITTTGASAFGDYSEFPPSLMFWRCLSHWIGGLGVVVFFVAVLSFLGASGKMLYSNEASADSGEFESERIKSGVWNIVKLYLFISICCFGAFKYFGMDTFEAVCHMFSVVSTGGFSTRETSFIEYNNLGIYWSAIAFMFIGGTSFVLLLSLVRFKLRKLFVNTEFWTYLIIVAVSSAVVFAALIRSGDKPPAETLTHSVFQTVSILTTTGLCSDDYSKWLPVSQIVLVVLMIIGGCSGSTSGGLKISRAVAALRLCRRDVEKSFRPRVVRNVFLNGKSVGDAEAYDILSYAVLYALVIVFGMAALALLEPKMSITGAITASIAAVGNVGPAFGEVGCASNYGGLGDVSLFTLSILMIMGRLEIYAILVLFMPSLWKKFQ